MYFLYLHVISIPNSFVKTCQCTRSVYASGLPFFNHCSLLLFLYFFGFLTSVWDNFFIVLLVLPLSFSPSLSLSLSFSLSHSVCVCECVSFCHNLSICPCIVHSFSVPERPYFLIFFALFLLIRALSLSVSPSLSFSCSIALYFFSFLCDFFFFRVLSDPSPPSLSYSLSLSL